MSALSKAPHTAGRLHAPARGQAARRRLNQTNQTRACAMRLQRGRPRCDRSTAARMQAHTAIREVRSRPNCGRALQGKQRAACEKASQRLTLATPRQATVNLLLRLCTTPALQPQRRDASFNPPSPRISIRSVASNTLRPPLQRVAVRAWRLRHTNRRPRAARRMRLEAPQTVLASLQHSTALRTAACRPLNAVHQTCSRHAYAGSGGNCKRSRFERKHMHCLNT